jgi:hypothetical protein
MRNISRLCYDLISPLDNERFKSLHGTEYSFELNSSYPNPKKIFDAIDVYVNKSRETIPLSFEGSWQNVKGLSRAVDWQDFLLYIIPTLVIQHLKHKKTKDALMNLVYGCSIALQWSISKSDTNKMNR